MQVRLLGIGDRLENILKRVLLADQHQLEGLDSDESLGLDGWRQLVGDLDLNIPDRDVWPGIRPLVDPDYRLVVASITDPRERDVAKPARGLRGAALKP